MKGYDYVKEGPVFTKDFPYRDDMEFFSYKSMNIQHEMKNNLRISKKNSIFATKM